MCSINASSRCVKARVKRMFLRCIVGFGLGAETLYQPQETKCSHGRARPDNLGHPLPTPPPFSVDLGPGAFAPFFLRGGSYAVLNHQGESFPPAVSLPFSQAALSVFTCRGKQRAWSTLEPLLLATRLWRPSQLLTSWRSHTCPQIKVGWPCFLPGEMTARTRRLASESVKNLLTPQG